MDNVCNVCNVKAIEKIHINVYGTIWYFLSLPIVG